MKTPRGHRVPLSVAALKIVTALHEVRVNEFVFPRAGQLDRSTMRTLLERRHERRRMRFANRR